MVGQPGSQDGFVIGPNGDEISKYEYNRYLKMQRNEMMMMILHHLLPNVEDVQ